MDNKKRLYICYLQETTSDQKKHTESKWIEKDILCKWEKTGIEILIAHKMDFKTVAITKDKEEHFVMIKRLIQSEDIILVTFIHSMEEHLNI